MNTTQFRAESLESTSTSCQNSIKIFDVYLNKATNSLGILANAFCVLIFIQILCRQRHEGHMFKYLLVKAVYDTMTFTILLVDNLFFFYGTDLVDMSSIEVVWVIWLAGYVVYVTESASICLEVAATFDCYISINKKIPGCLTTIWFYIVVLSTLVFNAFFHTFRLFQKEIAYQYFDFEYYIFTMQYLKETQFGLSESFQYFLVTHSCLRDVLPLLALSVLNGFILYSLRISTQRKRRLSTQGTGNNVVSASVTNARRAEQSKMLMIIFTGLNYLAGHVPILISYACYTSWLCPQFSNTPWICFRKISEFLLQVSYVSPILCFFLFNSTFKRLTLQKIPFYRTVNRIADGN